MSLCILKSVTAKMICDAMNIVLPQHIIYDKIKHNERKNVEYFNNQCPDLCFYGAFYKRCVSGTHASW